MIPETDHHSTCLACGTSGMHRFYAIQGIPLQSNLLLRSRDEALSMPTGDLDLAHCRHCGFISNLAFDSASQQLTAQYEASQGFSATFNSFTRSLAKSWSDRYPIAGKTAIEIGCGKGEFLTLLCQTAKCRGVGFDPTLDPNRLPDTTGLDIEWVAELFDERAAGRTIDFICCRHTLEHVPDAANFISMVRRIVGTKTEVRIGFEVPDTERVLDEGAFWDLYYEHCSYYTAGSLARLFARCGFHVLDIRREFDGQYLVIEAAPASEPALSPQSAADDLARFASAVAQFPAQVARAAHRWRGLVSECVMKGTPLALWGASSKAVGFLSTLGLTHKEVPFVVDINPHKQGTYLPTSGSLICSPDDLQASLPCVVIAMNPIYREEIMQDLRSRSITAEVLAL